MSVKRKPASYPEILQDLATIVGSALVGRGFETELASDVGNEAADAVRRLWGGHKIYICKARSFDVSERDAQIERNFNGKNISQLARTHDLSEMTIYQIIRRVRQKRQIKPATGDTK